MNHWTRRIVTTGTAALLMAGAVASFAQSYLITLTDLTSGQPFSPPVFATHDSSVSFWTPGGTASNGIQQIAEQGNRVPLVNDLTPQIGSGVRDLVTPLSSPLLPGNSVSIYINADAAHPFLSSAWMLGRTNDTFAGQRGINLLNIAGTQTFDLFALDAGTEVNSELAGDLIAFGGNGRTSENGTVHLSTGLRGIDHLDGNGLGVDINGVRTDIPSAWVWNVNSPAARVTITQVPEPGSVALMIGMAVPAGMLALRRKRRA